MSTALPIYQASQFMTEGYQVVCHHSPSVRASLLLAVTGLSQLCWSWLEGDTSTVLQSLYVLILVRVQSEACTGLFVFLLSSLNPWEVTPEVMQPVITSVASELLLSVEFGYGLMNMDQWTWTWNISNLINIAPLYAVSDANPKRPQCPGNAPCSISSNWKVTIVNCN